MISAGVAIGVSGIVPVEFFGPLKGDRLTVSVAIAGLPGGLAFGLVNGSSVLVSALGGAGLHLLIFVVEEITFSP